jgi:hypothetical protein
MDQGGDRRRAFHRIRQPGVQQELRRLAHRAHEQQQAGDRERVEIPAQEVEALADQARRLREDGVEVDGAGQIEHSENAKREAEVADAIDDEGFDGRRIRFRLVVPEADQEIARETDPLPAEEKLEQIVGRHQHQHREREERQVAEEPRLVRFLLHVADRIDVNERRDRRHHDQHYRGERVDTQRPFGMQIAKGDEGEQRYACVMPGEADIVERVPGQHAGDHQQRAGHQFGKARARGRWFGRCVLVVGFMRDRVRRIRRRRRVRVGLIDMRRSMVVTGRRRILPGKAATRAE